MVEMTAPDSPGCDASAPLSNQSTSKTTHLPALDTTRHHYRPDAQGWPFNYRDMRNARQHEINLCATWMVCFWPVATYEGRR